MDYSNYFGGAIFDGLVCKYRACHFLNLRPHPLGNGQIQLANSINRRLLGEKLMAKKSKSTNSQAWLMKTEPDVFSVTDFEKAPNRTTYWDGVRNYQARNFMRDQMAIKDPVLIYHSNADPSCIVGLAYISKTAYPDFTAWDPNDPHFDPKSNPDKPTWFMVDVTLESIFAEPLSLSRLRLEPGLEEMELLRKGSRLSVQPVRLSELKIILKLGKPKPVSAR